MPTNQPTEEKLPREKTQPKKSIPRLHDSQLSNTEKSIEKTKEEEAPVSNDVVTSRRHEVMTDVMTLLSQDINTKLWREIIEETETHNSSLRMSAKERDQIEDIVRDLKRNYKIKTSMNEIARLGLLFLIHDFKKKRARSIINEVKTS